VKYRKKPVVIEAVQWNGTNVKEVFDFMKWRNASHDERQGLVIHTLEGNHDATPGDFIIKGVKGEFYPCKPDIFAMTYESADASPAANAEERKDADLLRVAQLVLSAVEYRNLKDWQLMHIDLSEAAELARAAMSQDAKGEGE
jgi:hypothetical protein